MLNKPRVGVFALQGCVRPHKQHIEALGADFVEIRHAKELETIQGLILPGGESTTMLKLIDIFQLESSLRSVFHRIPVWGICAGAILMANRVRSPSQKSFNVIDIEIERNAYGRQLDSFNTFVNDYPVSFIRAPKITGVGPDLQIMAKIDGLPVWVQSNQHMATTFHPELTSIAPSPMHKAFFEMLS